MHPTKQKSRGTHGHGRGYKNRKVTQTNKPVQHTNPTPTNRAPSPGPSVSTSTPHSRPAPPPTTGSKFHVSGKVVGGIAAGAVVAGGAYYMYKRIKSNRQG